ncbi:gmp synthase [Fusarium sporotrichioides]|uniref:Gmp synthase n=1 Tax=Fusarium sporotrichioides TaxID=5514 RepID=A0A395RSH3_FUSSP|nr:gmp synthase [Fusarium sporotrichioides]
MTSKYKDIMKNGWHPEKSGTSLRGQVKGLVGRGKSDDADRGEHVSVPISQLKDPSSFAPPPKRTGTGLIPAAPRKDTTSPSNYQDPHAPVSQEHGYTDPQDQTEEPPKPRGPYRVNTTGLSTDNLPKPPGRRDGADGRSGQPPSYQSAMTGVGGGRAAPPSLPPRLPPRTNSASTVGSSPAASPAPIGNGLLNQGAVSRLGAAGINVPGFGIGRSSPATAASPSPPPPPRPGVASPPPPAQTPSQMSELQNRFSKLGTSSSNANTAAAPPPPSEGTTWAQKQAALKTASSFQKDPSSVSFSDARAAASTANNFRQRHGEQVAAGAKAANNFNQKYSLMDKAQSSYSKFQGNQAQDQGDAAGVSSPGVASAAGKKKPPPPPPKKKPALMSAPAPPTDDEPPPIPMATRPQF